MKDFLLSSLTIIHLVARFLIFFVLLSNVYKVITSHLYMVHSLESDDDEQEDDRTKQIFDTLLVHILVMSVWIAVTECILTPLQIFLMAQHEPLLGFIFSNMCESEERGTRSLCCACIRLYQVIAQRFDGVATKHKNEPGALQKRRKAAIILLVFVINQCLLTLYVREVLLPIGQDSLKNYVEQNNSTSVITQIQHNNNEFQPEYNKNNTSTTQTNSVEVSDENKDKSYIIRFITDQITNFQVVQTIQLLDTSIAIVMTLLLLINTAYTSSYIRESANLNALDRIMPAEQVGANGGGRVADNNLQFYDPNFNGNTQDFRYTTEQQVTTVDMLVFIEARTYASFEQAMKIVEKERQINQELKHDSDNSKKAPKEFSEATHLDNDQLKCIWCQDKFEQSHNDISGDKANSLPSSPEHQSASDKKLKQITEPGEKKESDIVDSDCIKQSNKEVVEPEFGAKITVLHCGHLFHRQCVHDWLFKRGTCPTCRQFVYQIDKREAYNQAITQNPPNYGK